MICKKGMASQKRARRLGKRAWRGAMLIGLGGKAKDTIDYMYNNIVVVVEM